MTFRSYSPSFLVRQKCFKAIAHLGYFIKFSVLAVRFYPEIHLFFHRASSHPVSSGLRSRPQYHLPELPRLNKRITDLTGRAG